MSAPGGAGRRAAAAIVVLAAVFRLGRYLAYVPWPVIEGFTVGIAVIIFLQQVPAALGVTSAGGEGALGIAIEAIAAQNPGGPNDVRKAFEARAAIDDINSIKPTDLEIGKEGNQVVIGFAYRKEIPLWGDAAGVYINYAARAGGE